MKFNERLKAARKYANLTQSQLSEKIGTNSQGKLITSQANLGKLEKNPNSTGSKHVLDIAIACGVNAYWLASGNGEMIINKHQVNQDLQNYEMALVGKKTGTVPIISWVKAGSFTECIDDAGEYEQVVVDCEIREHTYALRVIGDSMISDNAISFPEGIVIIIEPSMQAVNNDFVIAKNGDNEATFKQLIKDGGDWYLKPLNNRYPIKLLGHADIIGVVRQAIMKFK